MNWAIPKHNDFKTIYTKFYNIKLYFLRQLLITNRGVYLTTYCCGSVLYIDITYHSITYGPGYYIEFVLKIENSITEYNPSTKPILFSNVGCCLTRHFAAFNA